MNTPKTIALFTLGLLLTLSACGKKADEIPKETESLKAEAPEIDAEAINAPIEASGQNSNEVRNDDVKRRIRILPPKPKHADSDICPRKALKTSSNMCSCYYGGYDEDEPKPGAIGAPLQEDESRVLGRSFQCTVDSEIDECSSITAAVCDRIQGCMTIDGRWYPALSKATYIDHYGHLEVLPKESDIPDILAYRYTSKRHLPAWKR